MHEREWPATTDPLRLSIRPRLAGTIPAAWRQNFF